MAKGLAGILTATNSQKPIAKQRLKNERQPFKLKTMLAKRHNVYIFTVLILLLLVTVTNGIINYLTFVVGHLKETFGTEKVSVDTITERTLDVFRNMGYIFIDPIKDLRHITDVLIKPNHHVWLWLVFFSLLAVLFGKKIHEFYVENRKMDYGQKGNSEFASIRDLKKQYVSVPQQVHEYKGLPGVPITHYNDLPFPLRWSPTVKLPLMKKKVKLNPLANIFYNGRYLIDQDTINTMVIGTSRSGKGESMVFPATDIDTRASEKPSLVFNDPKGELYAGSYETLRKRGYDVEVLNLVNPDDGMSYNMLQIIKDEYIKGDFAQAEAYAVTLTSTLFPTNGDSADFWNQSAGSLVNALIFAVIQRSLEENNPQKITMRNVYDLLNDLGTKNSMDDNGVEHNALADYMMSLPDDSIAKKQYATTEFAGGNTRAGILATAASTLSVFVSEKISKMGSANSVDFTRVGFNKRMRIQFDLKYAFKRGVIHYGYGSSSESRTNFKVDNLGFTESYFKRKMKNGDVVRIEIEGDIFEYEFHRMKPQRGFVLVEHDPYTGERIYPDEAYLKAVIEKAGIIQVSCFYSEKPVAVFMVIPDYDTSVHVVASVFISQLYTMLARRASESGGKCHQRVKFRLDEFGNMPAIHDMANILTVCLGRNILFELYVQGYSQVFAKYGKEDGETIKDNCQTHIYIKSTSKETNEEISAKCGNKTVTTATKTSGESNFSQNFSAEQVPLILPEELPKFVRGETIVLRFLKSSDRQYNSVRPDPIFNTNETKLPFRFEFLADDFEPANQFADFDIPSLHRKINLGDYRINWNEEPKKYEKQANSYIVNLMRGSAWMKGLKDICIRRTGDARLYERLVEVADRQYIFSTIQSYLESIKISGEEASSITSEINAYLDKTPGTDIFGTPSEVQPEKFMTEFYFGDTLAYKKETLQDKLGDDKLFRELLECTFDEFERKLTEAGREDIVNTMKSLQVQV